MREFNPANNNKRFCSPECWRLGRNKRIQEWRRSKKVLLIKNCIGCKIEFKTYSIKKVFCTIYCMQKYWDKVHADRKTRKTSKRYLVADSLRANKHLSEKQYRFVIGSLLGDGCLTLGSQNFYRFSTTHSERQKEYMEWKHELLKPFTTNEIIRYERKDGMIRKDGSPLVQLHSSTICHDDFNRIRHILYRGKKKFVTRRYLNEVNEFALAVWYMDDGSFSKYQSVLHTDNMSMSEQKAIQKWFWQRWNIKCRIGTLKKYISEAEQKIYLQLQFGKEATDKLHSIIAPYIIPSMEYKLKEVKSPTTIR